MGTDPSTTTTIFAESWENFRVVEVGVASTLSLCGFLGGERLTNRWMKVAGVSILVGPSGPLDSALMKNGTTTYIFSYKMKGGWCWALFFWVGWGWPLRCRRENIYIKKWCKLMMAFFTKGRWHDFHVRFQGGEISFRKYDWLQIAVLSHHLKVHDASWCLMCFFGGGFVVLESKIETVHMKYLLQKYPEGIPAYQIKLE